MLLLLLLLLLYTLSTEGVSNDLMALHQPICHSNRNSAHAHDVELQSHQLLHSHRCPLWLRLRDFGLRNSGKKRFTSVLPCGYSSLL